MLVGGIAKIVAKQGGGVYKKHKKTTQKRVVFL
jgi:hypothetical protein